MAQLFRIKTRQRSTRRTGVASARRLLPWTAAGLAGASIAFLLDPASGRRRRALVRDKAARLSHIVFRRVPHRLASRGRYVAGGLRGVGHRIHHRCWHFRGGHEPPADDVTLAQRVRSEVFAPPDIPDGNINVDAHGGMVTLRGQLPSRELIDRVMRMTRSIEGVRDVRNLMHVPGEPVPSP